MTCTPSSKSWAFNTKITKKYTVEGFSLIEKKSGNLISTENIPSAEDLALLNEITNAIRFDPVVTSVGKYFGDPIIENISKTITVEYTITYRNTYNICTENGCDDWYLGKEATVAAANNDLIWLSRLFGKKITSITPKGYQLDKRSREIEQKALAQYENDKTNLLETISKIGYQNKPTGTYRINSLSNIFVPSMFYIGAAVSLGWTYDTIDLPIFGGSADNAAGTGGWLSPSYNFNVQKSQDLLSGWEKVSNPKYPNAIFFFKKIPGVPDPKNKYRMVPPDAYRRDAGGGYAFNSYGYSGSKIDGVTYYSVNQYDGPMPGAVENIDEYGQGTTPINEPGGPYGSSIYECKTTNEYGDIQISYPTSPAQCSGPFKRIYGGDDYVYNHGTWKNFMTGTVSTYEIVEDKGIVITDSKETTDCENIFVSIPVNGKPYDGGGVGESCKCN